MKRRLLLLNAALVAAAAVGLWRFRVEYRRAQDRYRLLQPAAAPAPPPPALAAAPPPLQPATYFDAAQKYLFSPDRNPTVAVEPPKVKPRPPLPALFGVMNIGTGPIALMAPAGNARHKAIRIGDSIGEFKLLAAGGDQITLEWEGEKIQAQVSDLLVKQEAPGAATAGAAAGGTITGPAALAPSGASQGNAATVLNPAGRQGEIVIGNPIEGRPGTYYSTPGDTAPSGTVHQGRRKVVRQTPFGTQAWWEDVKQ
jgi:hypothetical protein